MSNFNEQLPQWDNGGLEPTTAKKTGGWIATEKPPAEWLNWLFNRLYKCIQEIRNVFDNQMSVFTTTHIGNVYSVTVPGLTSLTDGYPLAVKFDAASTGTITINPSGLGAKSVVDYFGNAVTNVRANLIANLRYNATSGNFILLGKGGGGNATAAQLLNGKTATTDSGPIVGTMPDKTNAGIVITPGTTPQVIPRGYYPGGIGDLSILGDANLIPDNILEGKNIFNVTGTTKGYKAGTAIADTSGRIIFQFEFFSSKVYVYSSTMNGTTRKVRVFNSQSHSGYIFSWDEDTTNADSISNLSFARCNSTPVDGGYDVDGFVPGATCAWKAFL